METAKATLSNFRQAPRKMRMVANAVRGKKVSEVLVNLDFVAKKASLPIKNLILSALANAKNAGMSTENLIIKTITVDGGKIMYRSMPVARGSAHPIRKRTSSVFIELAEKLDKKSLPKAKEVKEESKVEKKPKAAAKKTTKAKTTKKTK
ncbi:MAG: 50S ribosomal protein L22 [Patescibacteria group bacterium]